MAEINGDASGIATGEIMGKLINGEIKADAARSSMHEVLCK